MKIQTSARTFVLVWIGILIANFVFLGVVIWAIISLVRHFTGG